MKNTIIKRPEQLILLLAIVLLTPEVFAQSGHKSDNVEYRIAVPLLPDGKNPVLGGKYTAKEESFIFGIIADRAGGNPLIGWPYFEEAVRTMNVLQPDFVFMPGDLIDGYVDIPDREGDAERFSKDFNEQFDLFTHFASKLEMPLYFIPGNHDLTVPEMIPPYIERFGKLWYSFDYRGVHFIALNTEAKPGDDRNFTEEQVKWAVSDIEKSKGARHTVVFLHNPAWYSKGTLMYDQWVRIENALKGRKYTVIAGHTHRLSTVIRNGRPYYVMATSGGGLGKVHSFYLGETHHTALVKVEGDTLHLSLIELGAIHSIEQVSKTGKPVGKIETISSLQLHGDEFQSEFSAKVTNPQPRSILVEFSLKGLSLNGWKSSSGERMTKLLLPGDSVVFKTVLSVNDPSCTYPPILNLTAKDGGLKLVDHHAEVPVFKDEDYRTIPRWYSAAPFDGTPISYTEPPFVNEKVFPAMFKDFGPESREWNPDDTFENGIGWNRIITNEKGQVDFGKMYGYLPMKIGYAVAFIESPDDRLVYFKFEANDYGRIWLNGEVVGQDMFYLGEEMKTFPVWLKKGRNTILVKALNLYHGWNFILKITDVDNTLKF